MNVMIFTLCVLAVTLNLSQTILDIETDRFRKRAWLRRLVFAQAILAAALIVSIAIFGIMKLFWK